MRARGFPNLRQGIETQREQGFPGHAKGLETMREQGFPNLVKGRETCQKNGYAGLLEGSKKGRATQADQGFPNLKKAHETLRAKGYAHLKSVLEAQRAEGFPNLKSAAANRVRNARANRQAKRAAAFGATPDQVEWLVARWRDPAIGCSKPCTPATNNKLIREHDLPDDALRSEIKLAASALAGASELWPRGAP
jgi:hypothetical protein